jgi:hypothetical protein
MGLFEERHERRMRDPEYAAAYAEADAELSCAFPTAGVDTLQLQQAAGDEIAAEPVVGRPPLEEVSIYAFA